MELVGVHWVWEGPLSLVQSDSGQLITPSRADTYVSNAVSLSCPACRSGHSPLHRAELSPFLRGWGSPQNHHITVLLSMSAATAVVVYREVVDGEIAKINAQLFNTHTRWRPRFAKRLCSTDPECTQHSSISKSEAPVLVDLTTKSAKKLAFEPTETVGLGLCSDAIPDVSCDFLVNVGGERVEPWLVWPSKELDCMVLTPDSHREVCLNQERWH